MSYWYNIWLCNACCWIIGVGSFSIFRAAKPKMVQNCVFAQGSELQFGGRMGITLVWQVWSSEKEWVLPWFGRFGVQRKASSFLQTPNPGRFRVQSKNWTKPWLSRFGVWRMASSFLWTLNTGRFRVRRRNRAKPLFGKSGIRRKAISFSELKTLQVRSLEKRQGPTLVQQVWSLEKGPSQTLIWQVRSSEKDQILNPNSEEKKKK